MRAISNQINKIGQTLSGASDNIKDPDDICLLYTSLFSRGRVCGLLGGCDGLVLRRGLLGLALGHRDILADIACVDTDSRQADVGQIDLPDISLPDIGIDTGDIGEDSPVPESQAEETPTQDEVVTAPEQPADPAPAEQPAEAADKMCIRDSC